MPIAGNLSLQVENVPSVRRKANLAGQLTQTATALVGRKTNVDRGKLSVEFVGLGGGLGHFRIWMRNSRGGSGIFQRTALRRSILRSEIQTKPIEKKKLILIVKRNAINGNIVVKAEINRFTKCMNNGTNCEKI